MAEKTKYQDDDLGPFFVDDGTGTAYVDPSNAEVVLQDGDQFDVEDGQEPPPVVREFIERETSLDPIGSYPRTYTEYRIDIDEEIRVAGEADHFEAPDMARPVTTGFVAAGDAQKFLVTDDVDLDLSKRFRQDALNYFVIGAFLLAVAGLILFMG